VTYDQDTEPDIELIEVDSPSACNPAASQSPSIHIAIELLDCILRYSATETGREIGGFLVGKVQSLEVTVTDFFPAKYTRERVASITFTHETWNDFHERRALKTPDAVLVGWHHTHPGYGVFLSGMDMFIHENFFNLPYQIALVVDPVSGRHAFYGWSNGEVIECPLSDIVENVVL